jgi:Tfp pilus assembly protein PilW
MLGVCDGNQKTIAHWLYLRFSQSEGTTLVEMLLAISLSTILVSALIVISRFGLAAFTEMRDLNLAVYSARSAGRVIEEDLRGAAWVQSVDPGRLVINPSSGGSVEYYLSDKKICRHLTNNNGNSTVPIAENISCVDFTNDLNLVGVIIRADCGKQQFTHQCMVYPRAIALSEGDGG